MWTTNSGSGGMTNAPNTYFSCFGYQDKYMPVAVGTPTYVGNIGYKAFRCFSWSLKMTVINYTGSTYYDPTLNGVAIGQNNGDIAFGLRPSGANTQQWDYPKDGEWPSDRAFKWKTVPKPRLQANMTYNGTTVVDGHLWMANEPKRTVKLRGKPWVAMQIPKKTYLTDDTFETVLSGTAGTPSGGGAGATWVDIVGFLPYYLQTLNHRMSCRVILSASVKGFFYRPNKMQSSIYP